MSDSLTREEALALLERVRVGCSVIRVVDPADPDSYRIVFANDAASEASGADVKQHVGKGFLEAYPMIRDTPFPGLYRQVVETGETAHLPDIVYGDDLVSRSVFRVALKPGPGNLVLGEYANVTAERRAEAELDALFDVAPTPLCQLDLTEALPAVAECEARREATDPGPTDWLRSVREACAAVKVVRANGEACELLGCEDELSVTDAFPTVAATGAGGVFFEALRAIVAGESEVRQSGSMWRKDGLRLDVLLSLRLLDSESGRAVLGLTDVSALRRSQDELERSNRDLSRFASVAAHDLSAPMRTIAGFADLLQVGAGEKLDERAQEFLGYLKAGSARLKERLDALHQFSLVGRGGFGSMPVDTGAVVQATIDDLGAAIEEHGAEVVIDELPPVMADPVHLGRVFENLINNAIKYRHPDRPPVVRIEATSEDGGRVCITVSDNGQGIPKTNLEGVFDIFRRLDRDTGARGEGLGLAVVRRIVEGMGGRVWAESEEGVGSRFRITLPGGADGEAAVA